jgi:hypothetical protein
MGSPPPRVAGSPNFVECMPASPGWRRRPQPCRAPAFLSLLRTFVERKKSEQIEDGREKFRTNRRCRGAARFKWAAFARSAPTKHTRERAPSIWAGSPDLIRLHPRDAGLTRRAGPPLGRRDAVECGRPSPGSSGLGGHRSTATASGCRSSSARAAECRLRRSGMSRVTEPQMNRGSRNRLSSPSPATPHLLCRLPQSTSTGSRRPCAGCAGRCWWG